MEHTVHPATPASIKRAFIGLFLDTSCLVLKKTDDVSSLDIRVRASVEGVVCVL